MSAHLECRACGEQIGLESKAVFACSHRGHDERGHILEKRLDPSWRVHTEEDSYLRFREFFYSYYLAQKLGVDYESVVKGIHLPFTASPIVTLGPVLFKNETGNIGGSHKARHLMGSMIYLEVLRKAGVLNDKPRLAIYSCGNAALGASHVAKAAGYTLEVFVPPSVNPKVKALLDANGTTVRLCPRVPNELGDPCYNRFQEALKEGAIPFSCSGPDNWSAIEGGETLGLELIDQMLVMGEDLDAIVIQIGGGALASSTIQAYQEAWAQKRTAKMPRIYAVQTEGGYPLVRAIDCIRRDKAWDSAIQHMKKYMWAWETEPDSIAHGILDDVTYDWWKIVEGIHQTGGAAIKVSEDELKRANDRIRRETSVPVDHTGTAGYAGYLSLVKHGMIRSNEKVAVLLTGLDRH